MNVYLIGIVAKNFIKIVFNKLVQFFDKKGKAFKGFFPFNQVVQSLGCLCQEITHNLV
jgi:hypothetical protein